MQRKILKYLYDIQESIGSIYDYLDNRMDFNNYKSNKLLRRAVERELEIIGEATNRILKINAEINISNSKRIVSLRNWVIHGYDKVDDVIIWGILSKDLPLLKNQINDLISKMK
ncbi:MAG: HepT-like ribonuclease domain-containing protein [Chitinophagales bacterium]